MSMCSSFAYTEDSQSEAGPHVSTVWIDDKPAHVGTPWWFSWVEAHVLTTWVPAFLQQPCGLSMQTSDFRVLRAKGGDWSLHSVSQRQLCGKKHTWCFRSHADIYNGLKWINKGHEGAHWRDENKLFFLANFSWNFHVPFVQRILWGEFFAFSSVGNFASFLFCFNLFLFFYILVNQLIPWEKQKLIENLMNFFSPFKISFIS